MHSNKYYLTTILNFDRAGIQSSHHYLPFIFIPSSKGRFIYKYNHRTHRYHHSWGACSMIRDTWSMIYVGCRIGQSNLPYRITRYVPSSVSLLRLVETFRRLELLIPCDHSFSFSYHSFLIRGSFVRLYSLARSSRWSVVFTDSCPP